MKQTKNGGTWVLFLIYLALLSYLLFFSHEMGRLDTRFDVNLVPFATIERFWNAWLYGSLGWYPVALNLIGNFVAFMPFGWFLPRLFTKMHRFYWFLLVIMALVLTVEVTQVLTRCGSGDIDDFILNTAGAFCAWIVLEPFARGHRK